jgi:hypothetical protein
MLLYCFFFDIEKAYRYYLVHLRVGKNRPNEKK